MQGKQWSYAIIHIRRGNKLHRKNKQSSKNQWTQFLIYKEIRHNLKKRPQPLVKNIIGALFIYYTVKFKSQNAEPQVHLFHDNAAIHSTFAKTVVKMYLSLRALITLYRPHSVPSNYCLYLKLQLIGVKITVMDHWKLSDYFFWNIELFIKWCLCVQNYIKR